MFYLQNKQLAFPGKYGNYQSVLLSFCIINRRSKEASIFYKRRNILKKALLPWMASATIFDSRAFFVLTASKI